MLTRLGDRARRWVARKTPWTNVSGLARTLIALATFLTLAANDTATLFRPAVGMVEAPICQGYGRLSLFCVVPPAQLELARWAAVVLLLVVASGWRPRVTGLVHWWVAFSFMSSSVLVDGGDQIAVVLATLLLPVCLTDRRRWHWDRDPAGVDSWTEQSRRLVAASALLIIRLQVAGIYFHAAVAKFAVPEWADGTATYYWFTDPNFGLVGWLQSLVMPIVLHPLGVTAATWGPMLVETLLFTGLVMSRRYWGYLLVLGLAFHTSIALVHGLISFGCAMFGALVLYLRPTEWDFRWVVRTRAMLVAGWVRIRELVRGGSPRAVEG